MHSKGDWPMMYEVTTKLYPHDICSSHVGFQVLGLDGKSRIELVSGRWTYQWVFARGAIARERKLVSEEIWCGVENLYRIGKGLCMRRLSSNLSRFFIPPSGPAIARVYSVQSTPSILHDTLHWSFLSKSADATDLGPPSTCFDPASSTPSVCVCFLSTRSALYIL